MSWLSKAVDTGKNLVFGSNPTGKNPYQAPNLDFLRQPAASTNYDFLKNPSASGFATPTDTSTGAFKSYADILQAPSSVDQVRTDVNNEALQNTLRDIYRTTTQNLGTNLIGSFSRGLYDPQSGADSDIARIGLAQTAAEGGRAAANAYTTLAGQNLDLEKQREQALAGAYGQQYQGALSTDSQNRGLANNNLLAYATGMAGNTDAENARRIALANALNGQAETSASSANSVSGQNPGLTKTFLNNWASSTGQNAGGGGGLSGLLGKIF